ncbi:MAG: class I SAM-dependent methyltransferase, partial [Caldilinea sp.]
MPTPTLTVLEEDKHAWFAGRTRAILKFLDAELNNTGSLFPRRVLDVGGGAGNMTHHLAHYGEVINVEYNPRPIPVAQQRGVTTAQGSGDHLPFPDNSFDLVALLDTVEHIPDELGVFEECARVLKPGGV